MDKWEMIGGGVGLILFAAWVPSMIFWVRRGVVIPRHIHTLALVLTCIGVVFLIGMTIVNWVTLKLAFAFLLIPPVATYFGWFWMFGPGFSEPTD